MKRLLLVLVLIGAGLTGLAYYLSGSSWPRWLGGHASTKNAEAGYTFASVERGDLTETISATGVLQPRDLIAVGSELPGKVIKLYPEADFNQTVKEGDPLLELDPRNSQDDLNRAKAALQEAHSMVRAAEKSREAAQKNLELKQDLLAKGIGYKKDEEQ
ncbi:MAG: biotin/lipoyl-binding protein, partial [Planctomycetes bacterium]|nr:biotin/lipoyl-binding protein [Planctomycetota bacterium]